MPFRPAAFRLVAILAVSAIALIACAPARAQITVGGDGTDTTDSTSYSGTQSLTKTGSNTVSLTGNNSYGSTAINDGTLQIGVGGTNGTLGSGTVANNATLAINRSDAYTISNIISGTGAFVQAGSGTTTLSGRNTFTGAVSINAGTLRLLAATGGYPSLTGDTTINSGGTLLLGAGDVIGDSRTVTVNGGTFNLGGFGDSTGAVTLLGGSITNGSLYGSSYDLRSGSVSAALGDRGGVGITLTKNSAGTVTLSGANTYSGGTVVNAGTLQFSSASNIGTGTVTLSGGALAYAGASTSITRNVAVSANSSLSVASGSTLTWAGSFNGNGKLTLNGPGTLLLNGSYDNTVNGIRVESGTLNSSRTTNQWLLGVGRGTSGGVDSSPLEIGAAGAVRIEGNENFVGGVTLNATTSGANTPVQIEGGLMTFVTGTAPLNNTIGKFTFVNGGTVEIQVSNRVSLNSLGGIVSSGTGSATISGGGLLNLVKRVSGDTPTIDVAASAPLTIFATIQSADMPYATGGLGITKTGAGTLTLAGANSYSGTTNISAGTLQIGNGGSAGTLGSGNVVNNATLAINRSDAITVSNAISGTGVLLHSGSGSTTISGSNAYSGGTIISSGTLLVGNSAAFGTGAITNNAVLGYNSSSNFTVSNAISGTGSLSKAGSGTLALGADNTYSGPTTISAGILQLGTGGTTGWFGSGALTNNGSLAINRSNAVTVDFVLSGSGAFIQNGVGTTTLTANNTYAGTTTISSGTLQIGNSGTTGSLGQGAVTNNAALAINRSDATTISNAISGTGSLLQSGNNTTTLTGANSYSGTTNISAGTLQVGNGGSTGTLGSGNVVNNGTLAFNRSNNYTIASNISGTGALVQNGAGTVTLSGSNSFAGLLTINNGIVSLDSNNALASAAGVVFGTSNTPALYLYGVSATLNGGLNSGTNVQVRNSSASSGANLIVNVAANTTATFAGVMSEVAGMVFSFTKNGAGTQILSGSNTYQGNTTVNEGTLALGASDRIRDNTGLVVSGGTFDLGGFSDTVGYVTLTSGLITNGTLTNANVNGPYDVRSGSASAVLAGSAALTKTTTNTVVLTGNNIYSGITTISAGTLQIGNSGTTGSLGSGAVTNNAALVINRSDAMTIANAISGTGSLLQSGNNTTTLTGANSYSGTTNISAGTLQIGNGGSAGTLGSGNVVNNATLAINRSDAITVSNAISGTGVLLHSGSGSTTISGSSAYSGGTLISSGTLLVGNSAAFGTGAVTNNAVLGYNSASNFTVNNAISGTGSLSKDGSGTLTLGADNTYSGPTTISAGILQLGTGGTTGWFGSGALTIGANGSLAINRSNAVTVDFVVSGSGAFIQNGVGTTTLTANNTYAGTTTISAGTLQVGNGGTTGSLGQGAVTNNAALAINRSDAMTIANAISGTGSFIQAGSGTTTLSGINSYTGATVLSSGALVFNNSSTQTFSGAISGTGALVQAGAGTTVLSGSNPFSGAVTINNGILRLNSNYALANAAGVVFGASNTPTLELNSPVNAAYIFVNGGLNGGTNALVKNGTVFNTGATLAVNVAANTTANFAGVISDNGNTLGFTKNGAGTQILSGSNTYQGNTTVNEGTLALGASDRIRDNTGLVVSGGTFDLGGFSDTVGYVTLTSGLITNGTLTNANVNGPYDVRSGSASAVLAGSAALTKTTTNTVVLTGNNIYSGITTISAGTLQIGNSGTTGSLGSGAVTNNASLVVNRSDAMTIANAIAGTGSLLKSGSNTLTLTGANTYSGTTNISAGTLQIGNGGSAGALGSGNVVNNATLAINRSDAITVSNAISGTGALLHSGSGSTTLSGSNAYSGGTLISSGTLLVGNSAAFGTGAITNNSVLGYSTASNFTVNNAISGTGSLSKDGSGTLALGADNTYSGPTTISAGILQLGTGGTTGWFGSGALTIGANGSLAINRSNAVTLDFVVSGSGALMQVGSGTTTLTANNTYANTTTISAGTLQVGNGGTTGSLGQGAVTNNAALVINRSDAMTIANAISGTGSFIQAGSGTTTLSGINSYTGATVLSSGALVFNNSSGQNLSGAISGTGALVQAGAGTTILSGSNAFSSALTINNGGVRLENANAIGNAAGVVFGASNTPTLDLNIAVATLNGGLIGGTNARVRNLSSSGANLIVNVAANTTATFAGVMSQVGSSLRFTKNGAGTQILSGSNTYGGDTTINEGTLALGASERISDSAGVVVNGGTFDLGGFSETVGYATLTSGLITNGTLTNANVNGPYDVRSGSASAVLAGSAGLTKTTTNTVVLTGNNTYAGTTTISAGTLQVGNSGTTGSLGQGAVTNNAALAINRSDAITIANAIAGTGSLLKSGSNTLTLTGANTYSGTTTISAGTLQVGDGSTGSLGSGAVVNNGALVFNRNSFSVAVDNPISGTGSVSYTGSRSYDVTGNSSYTGETVINGGVTIFVGRNSTYGSLGTGNVTNNGTLYMNRGDAYTIGGILSGTGSLYAYGTGTLTLSATNSFSGPIGISSGPLVISGLIGSGSYGGAISNSVSLSMSNSASQTLGGVISGTGSFTMAGSGTTTLTGTNSYSGSTTISAGTLRVGDGGASGSMGTGNVTNNATLVFNRSDASTNFYTISGTGMLVQAGSGTSTMSGNYSYSGGTRISAGTLKLGAANRLADGGAVTVDGGSFDLGGFSDTVGAVSLAGGSITSGTLTGSSYALQSGDVSATLAGTGALTKSSAGTVTLSATNTFTGATSISGGTLAFDRIAALATTSGITIGSGAGLSYTGTAGSFNRNITVSSGMGTVRNTGAGTLTLSGTLSKNGTVLRLAGGAFNVTGQIVGSSSNSDLVVDGASVTLSNTNSYNGPTFVSNGGTLTLGTNSAIPSNSVVTLGGPGAGTLDLGSNTNTIAGLVFSSTGSGGTLKMAANQTASAQLGITSSLSLGAGTTLDLTGMGTSAVLYRLISYTSETGTFANVTGLANSYRLVYGATALDAQQRAVLGTLAVTNPTAAIITGGSAAFTYTIGNTVASGGASLSFTGTGSSNVAGSSSGSASAAGTSTSITGLAFTGTSVGSGQTGTFTVNAPNAYGLTSTTGTVSVNVYGHGQLVLSGSTISLGNAYVGYASPLTATLTGSNAAGFRVAVSGSAASAGGISLSGLSNLSSTGTITATLATGGTAGAINQSFNYVYGDGSSVSSLSGYQAITGTAPITVTGALWNPAGVNTLPAVTLGNVRVGGTFATSTLTVTNTAARGAYTEVLGASGSTSGMASLTGSVTALAGGSSSTAISVGLGGTANTATAGVKSGAATLSFSSTGGPGTASIAQQTVAISGTVFNAAVGSVTSGTSVNLGVIHAGGSFAPQSLSIANTAPGTYSEGLNAVVSGSSGNARSGGAAIANLLAGGTRSTITASLGDTATDGVKNGTLTIAYQTTGITTSGLAAISAGSQVVSLTGGVFGGNGTWNLDGGGSWGMGANANWTSTEGVAAAPGTFAGYANTDSATFGSTLSSGTASVTLDGAQVSLASLVLSNTTGRYVIGQGSGGSLTLSSTAGTPTVNVVGTHEIAVGIAGSDGVEKLGAGTLVLSGSNSFTGDTTITAGTLVLANASALPIDTVITMASGATLQLSGTTVVGAIENNGGTVTGGTLVASLVATQSGALDSVIADGEVNGTPFAAGILKRGAGTTTVGAANTFTGAIKVQGGLLQLTASGSFDAASRLVMSTGATMDLNGKNQTFSALTGAGGTVALGAGVLTVNNATGGLFAGTISGSGSVVKTGGGRLELTGASTYTGPTAVQEGELKLNGSLASSLVDISSVATLSGTGSIAGDATIAGNHNPGNSPGVQTIGGNLTYSEGANVTWELAGNTADLASRGILFDGINVGNDLTFSGSTTLSLAFNSSGSLVDWNDDFWSTNKTGSSGWLIYHVTGTTTSLLNLAISGTTWFDSLGNSLLDVRPDAIFALEQVGSDVYLTFTAVPEPSTLALVGIGVAITTWFARRQRRAMLPASRRGRRAR